MYKVESGVGFMRLANKDNKVWIVPNKSINTALSIYQPSSVKGKLLKVVLPILSKVPQLYRTINAQRVSLTIDHLLRELICKVLGIDTFEVAIFEGTPSVHKKYTMQIFSGSKILAYCKVSNKKEIIELLKNEAKILEHLNGKGISGIPTCLYCGTIDSSNEHIIYITSSERTPESQSTHSWGRAHWDFISELHNKTKSKLPFADSDFAKSLQTLRGYLKNLPLLDTLLCDSTINSIEDYYDNQEVEFSAYHGDFTPWNMFMEKDELFVFDWEYCCLSYPPYLDWFHFFTQTAIFERNLSSDQIVAEFKNTASQTRVYIKDVELSYKMYLLSIISKYIDREGGNLSQATKELLSIWMDILRKI